MSNIHRLDVKTSLPLDPAQILAEAATQEFDSVMVIGILKAGTSVEESLYVAASESDPAYNAWNMERAKALFLKIESEVE